MTVLSDQERRKRLIEFRAGHYGHGTVTGAGICVFTQAPCIGSVCEQYDPWGEQCGIRAIGMAATAFMEAYALSPMEAQEDGLAEQILEDEAKMESDAEESSKSRGGVNEDVAQVGNQPDAAPGSEEPGQSGNDGSGETG